MILKNYFKTFENIDFYLIELGVKKLQINIKMYNFFNIKKKMENKSSNKLEEILKIPYKK